MVKGDNSLIRADKAEILIFTGLIKVENQIIRADKSHESIHRAVKS